MTSQCKSDVVVVGGGLVGGILALALAQQGVSVVVIEKRAKLTGSSFKSIALSASSYHILVRLGVWDKVLPYSAPIKQIHVSERGCFGISRLDAEQFGQEVLGYVVTEVHLLTAIYQCIQEHKIIKVLFDSTVAKLKQEEEAVQLELSGAAADKVSAQVCVVADGVQSELRTQLEISVNKQDYEQIAVVGHVGLKNKAKFIAYERFTVEGPIALLPLGVKKYAFVWTQPTEKAKRLLSLSTEEQLKALQHAFGYRLGFFSSLDYVGQYPLCRVTAQTILKSRVVLCGSAAHHLHPVAGQGLNLLFT